jgi:hypothetical protein
MTRRVLATAYSGAHDSLIARLDCGHIVELRAAWAARTPDTGLFMDCRECGGPVCAGEDPGVRSGRELMTI